MITTPKVALVTGTSSGFGQATAALLAARGFLVFGTSRAPAPSGSASKATLNIPANQVDDMGWPNP